MNQKNKDIFNPESIGLHNNRSAIFKKDYSDKLSDHYENAFKYGRKKVENRFLEFCTSINKNGIVLDAGCGPGYFINMVRSLGFSCVGADLSENMVKTARENCPQVTVEVADIRKLPFEGSAFDGIISIETIRYFSDRMPALKELYRVLKPKGKIFITAAPLFSLNFYGIFNIFCRLIRIKSLVSCFQSFETAGSIKGKLEITGFKNIKVYGVFFGPYFLLDKIAPKLSSFLLRRLEPIDDRLSKIDFLKNFSNHLIVIAEK